MAIEPATPVANPETPTPDSRAATVLADDGAPRALHELGIDGLRFVGAYRLGRLLGRGGMGQVFLAERDRTSYALKLLHPRVARREEYVRRFGREGHVARRLDHPNIVRVHEVGVERGLPFIVMEYVPGTRLTDDLRGRLPLAPAEALAMTTSVARAVAHAHAKGILHRDIKPENVLLDPDRQLKLIDFGLVKEIGQVAIEGVARFTRDRFVDLAGEFRDHLIELLEKPWRPVELPARLRELERRIADAQRQGDLDVRFSVASLDRLAMETIDDATQSHGLTATGECLGTPLYMSPEQFAGQITDGRTDLYSLGIFHYYLVTGRHPWVGDTLQEIGRRKLEQPAPDPCALNPELPRTHGDVILRLIATHPAARYPNARFLLEDLERLQHGEPPLLETAALWGQAVNRSAARLDGNVPREEAADIVTGLWHEFLGAVRIVQDGVADLESGDEGGGDAFAHDAIPWPSAPTADATRPADRTPYARHATVPTQVDPHAIGAYRWDEELGRNTQGVMYRAVQASTGIPVALWVFAGLDRTRLRRLRREARGAARVVHPSLIPILELGQTRGPDGDAVHFVAMPWTDGRSFAAVWEDLTTEERVRVLRDAARALGHAHRAGLSHRNLGLSSIRLPPGRPPVVLGVGFALASDLAGVAAGAPHPTSLHRAAPEQLDPVPVHGERVDVWALGVILYEILAGFCPFAHEDPGATERAIREQDPPPLPTAAPAELVALCRAALRKDPAARPADGDAFAAGLDRWLVAQARKATARGNVVAWRIVTVAVWLLAIAMYAFVWRLWHR